MKNATDRRIDEVIASGVTLRFTGRAFENAATPGRGQTFALADVMRRVYAGRAAISSPFAEGRHGHEILVSAPPRRSEAALERRAATS